jgi:hypothetical protein
MDKRLVVRIINLTEREKPLFPGLFSPTTTTYSINQPAVVFF